MNTRRRAFQQEVETGIRRRSSRTVKTPDGEITIPPHPGDYGFHYPDIAYISMAAQILERSNFTAWPDAGGLNDQDEYLIQDILTWLAVRDWVDFEIEHPDLAASETRPATGDEIVTVELFRE
jgi:hypothetical protein